MELTETQRERIKAEEIFRAEVRRTLDAEATSKRGRKEHLWQLLNSSFVLWLLSSILLAGFGKWYSGWESDRKQELQRAERARSLDLEIGNRITQAQLGIETNRVRVEKGEAYAPIRVYSDVTHYLNNSFSGTYDFSTRPEFRARNFRSLVIELVQLVDTAQQRPLRESISGYEILADSGSLADTVVANASARTSVQNAARLLEENVLQERWRAPWNVSPEKR